MNTTRKTTAPLILFLTLLISLTAGCGGRLISPVFGPVPPGSTNPPPVIGYVPNAAATNIAGTVGQVGQALPPPGNWIVSGAAALFVAGLGAYARVKARQAATGNAAQDILNAVITGVEAAGKSNPTGTAPIKAAIATHVAAAGYGPELDTRVQTVAKNVP